MHMEFHEKTQAFPPPGLPLREEETCADIEKPRMAADAHQYSAQEPFRIDWRMAWPFVETRLIASFVMQAIFGVSKS